MSKKIEKTTIKSHFQNLGLPANVPEELLKIEEVLIKECEKHNFEHSHDTFAEEPLFFKSIGYGVYAGCIIAYPQSTLANNAYLANAIFLNQSNIPTDYFDNPKDKYESTRLYLGNEIKKLVIAPGSNILKAVVDKNVLIALAKEGAYLKLHPVTNKADKEILTDIFKDNIISTDYGLYDIFNKAKEIYTTSASESVIFASALGKDLYSIEESGTNFKGAYSALSRTLFWLHKDRRKNYLSALCNSPISCVFSSKDNNVEQKIANFVSYLSTRRVEDRNGLRFNKR